MRTSIIFASSFILLVSGVARADGTCVERLEALGAKYRLLDAIEEAGGCGAPRPVQLFALNAVTLSNAGTFTCPFAEQLARWTRDVVVPAARRHFGSSPAVLHIGTSYQCRPQNRRPNAKLSEHSYANAVDFVGIAFEDETALAISYAGNPVSAEARFQNELRTGACRYFTTVLGPGADGLHDDHLHLDLRRRRGGYRICQ